MQLNVNFIFTGRDFTPIKVNPDYNLVFTEMSEVGDSISHRADRIMDYGYASIQYEIKPDEFSNHFELNLSRIKTAFDHLTQLGLQEILAYISFGYESQFNWEFTPHELKQLSELNITLNISAYKLSTLGGQSIPSAKTD
ncbi:hypothetical protein [Microcoleus sp. herbarium14]|uniref:hypothetical protein n=1 Tax=Microcoleus sp. herbarium14 TaxID=3055439 RepID=UPI002FD54266